jgi:hypothetical protein
MLKIAASSLFTLFVIVTYPLLHTNPISWAIALIGLGAWLMLGVWVMSLPES